MFLPEHVPNVLPDFMVLVRRGAQNVRVADAVPSHKIAIKKTENVHAIRVLVAVPATNASLVTIISPIVKSANAMDTVPSVIQLRASVPSVPIIRSVNIVANAPTDITEIQPSVP